MTKFLAPNYYYFLALSLALAMNVANVAVGQPILSCSGTPYPAVCSSVLGDEPLFAQSLAQTASGFRDLILRATLNRTILARRHALIGPSGSRDTGPGEAAWADCLELLEDTVDLLDRSSAAHSPADDVQEKIQTWLSAAMANQETCKTGFADLGAPLLFAASPFASHNLSEAISNLLAVNKALVTTTRGGGNRRRSLLADGYFPEWVKPADRRRLLQSGSAARADLVVAKDGSGDYTTISEAVAASVKIRSSTSRFVIHVKAGVYKENVVITKSMKNLMMIGDGKDATVVTGSRNIREGSTTFRSATFAIAGSGFIARDMTFENTAGPENHQAVALRSGSDLSVFYRCSFRGYQDTLYVYSQRQFYRDCDIYGTIDFIFGDAVAVIQNCNIYLRKPMSGQKNTVTAQGRADPNENTGISIHNSVVTAAPDLKSVQGSFKTYLGRPWGRYSRTVFMKTRLNSLIEPAGWLEWSGSFGLNTLYYGEYMNAGPGADTSKRVTWPGFHVMSSSEASKFTVQSFLSGDAWIPATGTPFTPGL